MAFIPTAGCVKVDIQYAQNNQLIHNIIWVSRNEPWTAEQRTALAAAISAWWTSTGKALHYMSYALNKITVTNQDSQEAPSTELIVSPEVPGTLTSGSLASGTAACATLRTALRGRNYRGRYYFGGLDLGERSDAISWTTNFIANAVAALGTLKTAIDALGAVWVVVSKWLNKVPRGAGLKTPITAVSMDGYIDSQRRRLGGRGT